MATTKEKAFALFTLHKMPSSPEVKALGIKSSTRWNYHTDWINLGKPSPEVSEAELGLVAKAPQKAKQKRAPMSVRLPGGATIGAYIPEGSEASGRPEAGKVTASEAGGKTEGDKAASDAAAEETKPESAGKPTIQVNHGEDHDHASIPGKIVGTGIPVSVVLSLKSLALFEVAHSISPTLTLDKFIDDCIEDFFQGRGKDLGLVEIGGRNV